MVAAQRPMSELYAKVSFEEFGSWGGLDWGGRCFNQANGLTENKYGLLRRGELLGHYYLDSSTPANTGQADARSEHAHSQAWEGRKDNKSLVIQWLRLLNVSSSSLALFWLISRVTSWAMVDANGSGNCSCTNFSGLCCFCEKCSRKPPSYKVQPRVRLKKMQYKTGYDCGNASGIVSLISLFYVQP